MKKPEPISLDVTAKYSGETFFPAYKVGKGIISVFRTGRMISSHLGPLPLPRDVQARMMLREIIDTIKPPNLKSDNPAIINGY